MAAETDPSQQGEREIAEAVAAVHGDAEPRVGTSSDTLNADHDTGGQLGTHGTHGARAEAEPGDATSGGDGSPAAVRIAAAAESPAIQEDAARAAAAVSSWPAEQLDRFQPGDGDDRSELEAGVEFDAGVADMDESRPPSSVVSPQQSFSWRQLPEPDFWGPARSGPFDVSQHALGALFMHSAWQTDAIMTRGALYLRR